MIGVVLNLLVDRAFKKHDTTVKPFEASSALITDGVFKITRNPMYLGMILILFGVTMLLGSAAPFAVVFLLAALLDRVFIAPEEQNLEHTFGEQFLQYRKWVRRWI
jgi:protein-S-isoprenylcysteine O-methyltransferase Ste14